MSVRNAQASNWVAERAEATASAFDLKGSSKSYTSFSRAFSAGDTVFYSAHDEQGNREAGYGVFNGSTEITRNPTATLVNNAYNSNSPSKVSFSGEVTVACTFNASAFNTLWKSLDAIDPDGDGGINIPPELVEGLVDALNSKAEQVDLEKEIQDRIDGDKALQDQIDALDPDGDRTVDWSEIDGKPTEFPPESHGHEIADVNGLQDALDAAGGTPAWDDVTGKPTEFPPAAHTQDWSTITNTPSEYPPEAHDHDGVYAPVVHRHEIDEINGLQDALDSAGGNPAWGDITGKPTEFPPEAHTHEQGDVDGLESRLEAIEDSITSGGGFVDAPNDGKLYGRQSEAWAEVVIPDVEDPDWADIQNKPAEFPPADHNHDGDYAPINHNHDSDYAPADHNHDTDYAPIDHNHDADYQPAGDYITEAPNDGKPYVRKSEAWEEMPVTGGGGGIEEAPKTGKLYARKDEAWQEFEAGDIEPGSKDGETLAWSTADAEWMPNDTLIVKGGKVGIGTDNPSSYYAKDLVVKCDPEGGLTLAGGSTGGASDVQYVAFAKGTSGVDRFRGFISYEHSRDEFTVNSRGEILFNSGSTATEAMRIDANGRVGIGTDNPSVPLEVNATTTGRVLVLDKTTTDTNSATDALAIFTRTSGTAEAGLGSRISFVTENSNGSIYATAYINGFTSNSASSQKDGVLTFSTANGFDNPVERMRVDASGNLLVGQNSASSSDTGHIFNPNGVAFHVRDGGLALVANRLNSYGDIVEFRKDGSSVGSITSISGDKIALYGAGSSGVVVDANGRVGIGTDSPQDVLHVEGGNARIGASDKSNHSASIKVNSGGVPGNESSLDFMYETNLTPRARIYTDSSLDGLRFSVRSGTSVEERMILLGNGRVGIGTDNPAHSLDVNGEIGLTNASAQKLYWDVSGSYLNWIESGGGAGTTYMRFATGNAEAMRIDASGRVGIGGQPSRSAKEIAKEAKDTLARWKSTFDERLKAEPKADKKAVTLEITGDEFDTFPTEETLVERLTERNIGGGTAKLQVAGDGYFTGTVNANSFAGGYILGSSGGTGFRFSTNNIRPVGQNSVNGGAIDAEVDIGHSSYRFKDAHFSGTVNAGPIVTTDSIHRPTACGIRFAAAGHIRPTNGSNVSTDALVDIGETNFRFKDAHFSGTIYGKVADVPDHVKNITPTQIANWDAGTGGGGGGATTDGRISDTQITHWDTAYGWGNHAAAGYQPAGSYADANHTHSQYLTSSSLTGYATESWVNSQGFAKGSFVPTSGNTTISGTLTATDFVATSDERLKQNATTAPVGLVDQLRGVEFEWREDGRQDAGVIAQEVEKVLPHLVHDNGEHKAVNYNGLVAYLIEEVKSLRAEVEGLKR